MTNIYLKQAWILMKQNRLFTTIYVIGTGLSIALVMTLFIIFYVKLAPIYPEYNRDRMLLIKAIKRYPREKPENWNINGGMAYYVISDLLPNLPHVEKVGGGLLDTWNNYQASALGGEPIPVAAHFTDGGYWEVFTYRFLQGHPFTQEEVEANQAVAVLSESLARRLFASTDVLERHFMFNGMEFRICGIVADVSNATPETAGDLWLPAFHHSSVKPGLDNRGGLLGNIYAYLLIDETQNRETVRREVQEAVRQYSLQDETYEYDLMDQPDLHWVSTFRQEVDKAPNLVEIGKNFLYLLLALLLIPAFNLSGMISSRMDRRLCELGVRKAYGATNGRLLEQVMCENLLLTVLGGLVGLLISYLIVLTASDWILTLFDTHVNNSTKGMMLTAEMLFNPSVFGIAFGLCLILNVVSALIPACSALRHTIVHSLNTKR